MDKWIFAAAVGIGGVVATVVTVNSPEPGVQLVAPSAGATPVASAVPSEEPAPASEEPTGENEPILIGFDAGASLTEGQPLELTPPAAGNLPKGVRFGVVLVVYANAEGAATGARNKADALALANALAAEARTDFKSAVAKGDPGSIADAGRIGRGTLEPAPENALFQLEVGGVSGPIDTPRGFWIVKRID